MYLAGGRFFLGSLLFFSVCYGQLTFPELPNPHGTDQCAACHSSQDQPSQANFVPESCEYCHSRAAVNSQIHQLDNINIQATGITVSPEFELSQIGRFECSTCHTPSCKPDRANPTLLRGGPYQKAVDFCYNCHARELFVKLNPHQQFKADGNRDESTCLQCHLAVPQQSATQYEQTELRDDLVSTCNKCHALDRHERDHLGRDLSKVDPLILKTLQQSEQSLQLSLPLSSQNEIQCNTCHYTHQRGILEKANVLYSGAEENQWRLRIPKEKLCLACHDL